MPLSDNSKLSFFNPVKMLSGNNPLSIAFGELKQGAKDSASNGITNAYGSYQANKLQSQIPGAGQSDISTAVGNNKAAENLKREAQDVQLKHAMDDAAIGAMPTSLS